MKLENGDIILRRLVEEDALKSVEWRNNPEIWKYTINSPDRLITVEDELNWINKVINEESSVRFAIEYKNNYVGNIQFTELSGLESYCGIFIGEVQFWGKGIAFKALKLLVEYGFEELKLRKIKARIRVQNDSSLKVYRKLGFDKVDSEDEINYMELDRNNYRSNA